MERYWLVGGRVGGMLFLALTAVFLWCLPLNRDLPVEAASSIRLTQADLFSSTAYLDIVINEVAWMGTAASDWDEWIELYNNTAADIDLSGWVLTSTGGVHISLHGVISAHSIYLMERDDRAVSDITAHLVYGGQRILNTGEELVLLDNVGHIIDTANR
ncbi:MAG: lamin tail domain-containing protein, partial [Anaerolineae bacterium]|nr:lamin tail domain-containing protein [Anaerolineae bacterium]